MPTIDSTRSMPRPPSLRRAVRCAETSACDCSSSRRSPSGSSLDSNSPEPDHTSKLSVAPSTAKNRRLVSMRSYPDVGDLANHQNSDDLRNDRVGKKFAADRVGPEQPHVL